MTRSSVRTIHLSIMLTVAAAFMHAACSNSNFKGASDQGATPNESENAKGETPSNVEFNPIGVVESQLPPALKPAPDSLLVTFPTTVIKNAENRFILDLKGASTSVKLEDRFTDMNDKFTQVKRDQNTDAITQGNAGNPQTQKILQSTKKGALDIVLVIDNSGSMAEEQANLSTKLNDLLVSISDSNWRINVINTSVVAPNNDFNNPALGGQETCNSTLISKTDATAATDFANAVKAGVSGNGNEQGIRQAVVGLKCAGKQPRVGASVAVLIVSDEDNCSLDGGDCGTAPWAKETYLIDQVEKTMGLTVGKNAGFYGIIAPSKALCSTAGNPAPQYIRLFNYKVAVPGSNYGNICDANYKATLNKISENIALLLGNEFVLDFKPSAGSLKVSVQSAAGVVTPISAGDYVLNEKTVLFNVGKEPAMGSTVIFDYTLTPSTLVSSMDLTKEVAPGTLLVTVNNVALPATAYTLANQKLTFATPPAENAAVKATYKVQDPNKQLFNIVTLSNKPSNGVTVKINNVLTNAFTLDANNRKVTFDPLPGEDLPIEVAYKSNAGLELKYPVSIAAGAKNFTVLNGATPVAATVAPDLTTLTLGAAGALTAADSLTVKYELPDGAERRFPLTGTPEANSINIQMMNGTCALGTNLKIDAVKNEVVATCPVTERTEFILTYKYQAQVRTFTVAGIPDTSKGTFAVYYKGELTTDYTRDGATVTLNFEPEVASKVVISYTFPE